MKKLSVFLAAVMLLGICGCKEKKEVQSDEAVTLTWYVPGEKQTDMEQVMEEANKIIEPAIGAKLDLQMIDTGSYAEKMQMMMAAGEVFDLMFTGYINTYSQCVSRGGLMDITDLLAEHTPGFVETIPDYAMDSAYVDGRIYAIPNVQVVTGQPAIAVRKDIADEYGLDTSAITSAESLYDFYDWILETHSELYPMRAINMTSALPTEYYNIFDSYVVRIDDLTDGDDKIKVMREADVEEYRWKADKRWEWYSKGYIRNDVMTTSNDTADYNAAKYVTFYSGSKPGYEKTLSASLGTDYEIVLLPGQMIAGSAAGTMIGVSRTCKNPDKAVKLIELMNTNKELYNLICFGIEGKHYTLDEDGKAVHIENSGYDQKSGDWKFGNQFNALIRQGQDANIWEETAAMNESALRNPLAGFVFDNTAVAAEVASVETIISQYNVILYGAQNPDEYWDEMVTKLDNAGQLKILEEVQKQVDEYMKKNS